MSESESTSRPDDGAAASEETGAPTGGGGAEERRRDEAAGTAGDDGGDAAGAAESREGEIPDAGDGGGNGEASAGGGDAGGESEESASDEGATDEDEASSDEGEAGASAPPKKPVPEAPAVPAKKKVPKAPSKPKPSRPLPSSEDVAAWIGGGDVPLLGALFDPLPVAKLDVLMMQIKKEELLPQHWQVISHRPDLDDETFERLPEAGRLRLAYRDQELSRRRLAALKAAWRELAGRQPSLWTVSDLYAAIRRLIDKEVEVDLYDLLTAVRDVWAGMTLPHGKEQLEVLWAVLDFQRSKTK